MAAACTPVCSASPKRSAQVFTVQSARQQSSCVCHPRLRAVPKSYPARRLRVSALNSQPRRPILLSSRRLHPGRAQLDGAYHRSPRPFPAYAHRISGKRPNACPLAPRTSHRASCVALTTGLERVHPTHCPSYRCANNKCVRPTYLPHACPAPACAPRGWSASRASQFARRTANVEQRRPVARATARAPSSPPPERRTRMRTTCAHSTLAQVRSCERSPRITTRPALTASVSAGTVYEHRRRAVRA